MTFEAFVKKGKQELERYNLDEIAHLRAEVERLTNELGLEQKLRASMAKRLNAREDSQLIQTAEVVQECDRLQRERDEALDSLSSALDALSLAHKDLTCSQHDDYKMVWCNECIKIEREVSKGCYQEALAQVAELATEAKEIMALKGSYDVVMDTRVQSEYERAYAFVKKLATLRGALAAREERKR